MLHWSYHRRRTAKAPLKKSLGLACLGGFLIKWVVSMVAYWEKAEAISHLPEIGFAMALNAILGAVPFACLWVVATAALDSAWSGERRAKFSGPTRTD